MIKLILAILCVFGVYLVAFNWFPSLQNKALTLGQYDVSGVQLLAVCAFLLAIRK